MDLHCEQLVNMNNPINYDPLSGNQEIFVTLPSPNDTVDQFVLGLLLTPTGLVLNFYEDGVPTSLIEGTYEAWHQQSKDESAYP